MTIRLPNIISSIRAKVWLCVLVAFIGFALAALASFRFTAEVSNNLTEMQEIDFKVTSHASNALNAFKEQTKLYEDAFLTGDQDKVDAGNALSATISSELNQMNNLIKRSRALHSSNVGDLLAKYEEYAAQARTLYQNPGGQNLTAAQRDLQALGKLRMTLLVEFEELHLHVTAALATIIQSTRKAANRTNIFMVSLFAVVFFVSILLVNSVANKLLIKPLLVIQEGVKQMSQGDLSFSLPSSFRNKGEIGSLGVEMSQTTDILKSLVVKVHSSSTELLRVTESIRQASLAVDTAATDQGKQLENITRAVNKILESTAEVSSGVDTLARAAFDSSSTIEETAISNSEVAANAKNLFHAVEEVKTSISTMTASISQVADFTGSLKVVADSTTTSITGMDRSIKAIEKATAEAAVIALEVRNDAEVGKESVDAVIEGMKDIKTASHLTADAITSLSKKIQNIRGIISTINEFMAQTNLLALNAAIIAAQSGINGKSFAVVADEIRKLSIRTASSTEEIKNVISGVNGEAQQTVSAINRVLKSIEEGESLTVTSGEALRKIVTGVEKSADRMGEIAQSTVEQSQEGALIKDGMSDLMMIVERISEAMAEQRKGGESILAATERMYAQTAQVQNSTLEQSKASKDIALSIGSIIELIRNIKFSCDFQVEESETIVGCLDGIKTSNEVNLATTQTLNAVVGKLGTHMAVLQKEITFFKTNG